MGNARFYADGFEDIGLIMVRVAASKFHWLPKILKVDHNTLGTGCAYSIPAFFVYIVPCPHLSPVMKLQGKLPLCNPSKALAIPIMPITQTRTRQIFSRVA